MQMKKHWEPVFFKLYDGISFSFLSFLLFSINFAGPSKKVGAQPLPKMLL